MRKPWNNHCLLINPGGAVVTPGGKFPPLRMNGFPWGIFYPILRNLSEETQKKPQKKRRRKTKKKRRRKTKMMITF